MYVCSYVCMYACTHVHSYLEVHLHRYTAPPLHRYTATPTTLPLPPTVTVQPRYYYLLLLPTTTTYYYYYYKQVSCTFSLYIGVVMVMVVSTATTMTYICICNLHTRLHLCTLHRIGYSNRHQNGKLFELPKRGTHWFVVKGTNSDWQEFPIVISLTISYYKLPSKFRWDDGWKFLPILIVPTTVHATPSLQSLNHLVCSR